LRAFTKGWLCIRRAGAVGAELANAEGMTSSWSAYEECPTFFRAKPTPELIELPPAKYLAIAGRGVPGGAEFQAAIGAIYAFAYTTKMRLKRAGRDFRVATLEATWSRGRGPARWRLLTMVPEFVTEEDLAETRRELARRKKPAAGAAVELVTLDEGWCVQALHVGPYATEPGTVRAMQRRLRAEGLRARGVHHEIYLGDPRRTKPERLKTILRMPVAAGRASRRPE
jgi:hypothetical protein